MAQSLIKVSSLKLEKKMVQEGLNVFNAWKTFPSGHYPLLQVGHE